MELPVKNGNGLPGAARLLGLIGIKEDLNVVNDLCLAALELLADDVESVHALDEKGRTWLHAYYVSALITYARCFNGGVRARLDVKHVRLAAAGQAEEAAKVHRAMMLTRDRHLAHPVSPYEDGILGVIVRPDESVYGLDAGVYKQTTAPHTFKELRLLVSELLPLVNEAILKAQTHVRARAEALTPNKLAALPEAEWIPPSPADLDTVSTDPRHIPEGGARGYVRRVVVSDETLAEGQVPGVGPDGPMRRRQSVLVTGADKDAVFQDLGSTHG